ncbi:Lipase 1 precursor [Roseovarius litorisediminis]|uniref:Lipase 1 n=1 Tax=Roseovarius litorisediminis TaxID=1312363 RepID=A0A1Y5T0M2_9RHOB|nr:alpha/beta hydrolase [Roseovarius litorisediminis]SLN52773.1 Lipase 1 precursor [Roseovarius litorisediminis]
MRDPLVFLPGMMCDLRLFSQQLIDLGREVPVTIAPITQGVRIEEIASNLLDGLPRRFALAGLSLGGIVAMEILRRAPDRVTRIALMDTNPLAETPQSATEYEPFIIKLRSGCVADAVQSFLRPEYLAPGPGRAEVMGQLIQMAENIGADAIIRQTRAMQRRRDYQSTLRRCKVPALVLCGQHDGLTPVKRHSFMAELIPVAELAVIEDAGHLPTLEAPEATTEALRAWLKLPYVLQTRADA